MKQKFLFVGRRSDKLNEFRYVEAVNIREAHKKLRRLGWLAYSVYPANREEQKLYKNQLLSEKSEYKVRRIK